jgi:hypothetical protein
MHAATSDSPTKLIADLRVYFLKGNGERRRTKAASFLNLASSAADFNLLEAVTEAHEAEMGPAFLAKHTRLTVRRRSVLGRRAKQSAMQGFLCSSSSTV